MGTPTSGAGSPNSPEVAARASFVLWAASHGVDWRNLTASAEGVQNGEASIQIEADIRPGGSVDWQHTTVMVPVRPDGSGNWQLTPIQAVDRLVATAHTATAVSAVNATAVPTPIPTPRASEPTPSPTPVEVADPPPPPEGVVVYESDWSTDLDGWIGTPDWQAFNGLLVNDGSRASRDPWIEAPVRIDPWQAMVVEFAVDAPPPGYGSFGLIARGSDAGWYQLGVRWEDFARGTGTSVVTLGASIRQQTRRVEEEMFATRHHLTPGTHTFRAEFRDGAVSFFVDGDEVGSIADGSFYLGEYIGLWSERTPLQVHYFRVTLV